MVGSALAFSSTFLTCVLATWTLSPERLSGLAHACLLPSALSLTASLWKNLDIFKAQLRNYFQQHNLCEPKLSEHIKNKTWNKIGSNYASLGWPRTLCSPGWLQTHSVPPTSIWWMLGSKPMPPRLALSRHFFFLKCEWAPSSDHWVCCWFLSFWYSGPFISPGFPVPLLSGPVFMFNCIAHFRLYLYY